MEARKKQKKGRESAGGRVKEDAATLREQGRGEILSDILGSYTGAPEDGGVPVQDADDL